jgi:myosin-heavy-chain kinase
MHFTYEFTGQALIALDLRTLEMKPNEFYLTEPIVFSTDTTRFGSSNLGAHGIEAFIKKHECNSFCTALGLRSFNRVPLKEKTIYEKFCSIS